MTQGTVTKKVTAATRSRDAEMAPVAVRGVSGLASKEVEAYIEQCGVCGMRPDASVLVSLATRWEVLAPSFAFGCGEMMPLLEVLSSESCSVRRLVLRTSAVRGGTAWDGEGSSCDARATAQALLANRSITEVDMASCGLRDLGVAELARAIEASPEIARVDLRRNAFGEAGCAALCEAIGRGKAAGTCGLRELNVELNGLGHKTVTTLRAALSQQQPELVRSLKLEAGNYTTEEVMNALTHGIGCVLSLLGSVPLLSDAAARDRSTFWLCAVYSASLVFAFAASCAYHACFQLPTAFKYLQRADHAGIYLLIAGSYTAFLGVGMSGHLGATAILALVWIVGAVGALLCAAGVGFDVDTINPLEVVVYAAMGLAVLPILHDVKHTIPTEAFVLLVFGGASYLVGIFFFVKGAKVPVLHVVWHLFVLTGAFAHWFAIYLHLLDYPPDANDNVRAHLLAKEAQLASVASSIYEAMLHDRNVSATLPAHLLPSLLAAFSHRSHSSAADDRSDF